MPPPLLHCPHVSPTPPSASPELYCPLHDPLSPPQSHCPPEPPATSPTVVQDATTPRPLSPERPQLPLPPPPIVPWPLLSPCHPPAPLATSPDPPPEPCRCHHPSPRRPRSVPALSPQLAEGRDAPRKTWSPRLTLRSHYDAVRALAFHPAEAALVTASEDGTLKLWNLQKPGVPKKWVTERWRRGRRGRHAPRCHCHPPLPTLLSPGTRRWTWSRSTPSAGTGEGTAGSGTRGRCPVALVSPGGSSPQGPGAGGGHGPRQQPVRQRRPGRAHPPLAPAGPRRGPLRRLRWVSPRQGGDGAVTSPPGDGCGPTGARPGGVTAVATVSPIWPPWVRCHHSSRSVTALVTVSPPWLWCHHPGRGITDVATVSPPRPQCHCSGSGVTTLTTASLLPPCRLTLPAPHPAVPRPRCPLRCPRRPLRCRLGSGLRRCR